MPAPKVAQWVIVIVIQAYPSWTSLAVITKAMHRSEILLQEIQQTKAGWSGGKWLWMWGVVEIICICQSVWMLYITRKKTSILLSGTFFPRQQNIVVYIILVPVKFHDIILQQKLNTHIQFWNGIYSLRIPC